MSAIRLTHALRMLAAVFLLTISACNSGKIVVKQPSIDASAAGKKALEMYDKNGDGVVSGDELEHAPALKEALGNLDTNGDKAVSADEVAARVNAWKAMKTGMTSLRCHVTLDGEPLTFATVTFEPESFLGNEIKTAIGTTNAMGDVAPSIPKEQRSSPKVPGGAHFGLYKVRISKIVNGKETIPAKYNTDTILGQEVSYDDPAMKRMNMTFALKSKP
ncbi:MAG TPA: hypothetical protein VHU84_11170 [Lacipirellulaceae bacterium]|nr:hypothetical protein [Lacipirellulaceae bacterium]